VRFVGLFATAVLALAGLPAVASAAPGDLDSGFGSAGVAALGSGTELDGVAVQADGRPVAVGASGSSLLVARFSAGGALQEIFAAGQGVGRAVAIQSDGKIVVAGNDSAGMLVKRFNSDGSPDASFGVGGAVHAVAGGQANAVALGPGGTIVAAGQFVAGDTFKRVALLRLTATGAVDGSFGSGGVDVVDLDQDSVAKGVAVQQDGKIIFSGSVGPGTHQVLNAFVVRLLPGGTLDPSFGTGPGGIFFYFHPGGGAASTLNAVTLDPAGGIVAAGGDSQATPQALFIRLTCAGTPAGGFGSGGIVTLPSAMNTNIGEPLGAAGVAVAAGEHVVGAGRYQDSGQPTTALWGLGPSGSQAFSTHQPASFFGEARALALGPSGNVVVAGDVLSIGSTAARSGFVARYEGFGAPLASSSPCGGNAPPPPPPPPPPSQPTVSTSPASQVTQTAATLSGSVNPNGLQTVYHFEYGKSIAYGSSTPSLDAGGGSSRLTVSTALAHLAPGTTYHFRLTASNAVGKAVSIDRTFTTGRTNGPPPTARLAVLSQTVFVSAGGMGSVLEGCFGSKPCVGSLRLTSAGHVVADRTSYVIHQSDEAIVHITLTTPGLKSLQHAHGRLTGIRATVREQSGATHSAAVTLVELGPSPKNTPPSLSTPDQTAFASSAGGAGVLEGCVGSKPCIGSMTLTSAGHVIATRTRYVIREGRTAIVHITLTAAGLKSLHQAGGQLRNVRANARDHSGATHIATIRLTLP
jgi:uncharacterized delta-60 repeat protein